MAHLHAVPSGPDDDDVNVVDDEETEAGAATAETDLAPDDAGDPADDTDE